MSCLPAFYVLRMELKAALPQSDPSHSAAGAATPRIETRPSTHPAARPVRTPGGGGSQTPSSADRAVRLNRGSR
jgi:hypothetical protein